MTGLFKKKKIDRLPTLPADTRDVVADGRTESIPKNHDNDTPIELQTIDKQLSKLINELKHAKNPGWFYGTESDYNTVNELQANKIFQMESEIRKLELRRIEVLNSLQLKKSNSIPNNSSNPFPKSEKEQKIENGPSAIKTYAANFHEEPSESQSLQILKLRLAKGEITKEEFIDLEKLVK